jgi:hypothetical protein
LVTGWHARLRGDKLIGQGRGVIDALDLEGLAVREGL